MNKNSQSNCKVDNSIDNSIDNSNFNGAGLTSEQQTRRDFMKKYGKLAAVTPVALTALMSPKTSAAPKSCKPQQDNKHCSGTNGFNGF